MRLPKRLVPLAWLLILTLPVRGQESVEEGGFAPPGRWTTDGGSPSRSGQSFAPPIRRAPEEAWKVTTRGRIEGEPRVWDGVVTLSVAEAPGRRAIQQLDLESGRTLTHQVLPASEPLSPAVWMDTLVVRPTPERVDVYRVRAGRLQILRTIRGRASVSRPLVVEGELYLRVDDVLQRYDFDRNEPVWSAGPGGVFRGTPAVRGGGVYALWYDERGNALASVFARKDGRELSRAPVGHHGGEVPKASESAEMVALESSLFLRYPRPVVSRGGEEFEFGRVYRDGLALDERSGSLEPLLGPPSEWRGGWLSRRTEDGLRWTTSMRVPEGTRVAVVADPANHPELTLADLPATLTGDIVYVNGIGADLRTGEILWKRERVPLVRPVAAGGFLLVVEEEKSLLALREPTGPRSAAETKVAAAATRLEAEVAEGYALLAYESLRLGDSRLTGRLVGEAVRRGARGRTLDSARDGLDRITRGRQMDADPRRLEALLEKERRLLRKPESDLYALARGTREGPLQRAYLRAVLQQNPVHLDAAQIVNSLIPRDAPRSRDFDPQSWLDYLDVVEKTPVTFVRGDPRQQRTPELEVLERERERWREDVDGYRSERLFIVSPPGRPGAVARCLEVGELVCTLLEDVFGTRPGLNPPPLTLLLYESRDAYIDGSRRDRSMPEAALGWTAGHYSAGENLSRVYVPQDDSALETLLGTYAHEMTHHWLATRAPFGNRYSSTQLPFWIVEGFATLIEEFTLDPRGGTWDPINPRAGSLDVVANAGEEELLAWASVLTLSHREFSRLSSERHTSVPLAWRLGQRAEQSEVNLFYSQAGAAAHYLYSQPELRAKLVEYVAAWYRGEAQGVDARVVFGVDLAELGGRVREYAGEVVGVASGE